MLSFHRWKGFITVKWCDFLDLSDCSHCSFIHIYQLIHITDDYSSKNVIGLIFCEITNSQPKNAVSVSRYLVKNFVIFTHFITLATPIPAQQCTTSHQSQPTWSIIININDMKLGLCTRAEWRQTRNEVVAVRFLSLQCRLMIREMTSGLRILWQSHFVTYYDTRL